MSFLEIFTRFGRFYRWYETFEEVIRNYTSHQLPEHVQLSYPNLVLAAKSSVFASLNKSEGGVHPVYEEEKAFPYLIRNLQMTAFIILGRKESNILPMIATFNQ